jgi:ferrous iron transport protein A
VIDKNLNTLAQLQIGEKGIIHSFTEGTFSIKLLEMGCTPGEKVRINNIAPLGDPIAISVSGYLLSLRKEEASTILVAKE